VDTPDLAESLKVEFQFQHIQCILPRLSIYLKIPKLLYIRIADTQFEGDALSISSELTSRPLLARLLRLVEGSKEGVTANEAATVMRKHLASVYSGLRELEKRELVDMKESDDKRETIFVIENDAKRRRARLLLQELRKARFLGHPQLTNYVMSDLEERIITRLDKVLPDCKVSKQQERYDPDIVIQRGKSSYGVEVDIGYNWPSREDHIYGRILRTLGSGKFTTIFLIIVGALDDDAAGTVSARLRNVANLNPILVPEIDVFLVLPDEEKWDKVISELVVKPIATLLQA